MQSSPPPLRRPRPPRLPQRFAAAETTPRSAPPSRRPGRRSAGRLRSPRPVPRGAGEQILRERPRQYRYAAPHPDPQHLCPLPRQDELRARLPLAAAHLDRGRREASQKGNSRSTPSPQELNSSNFSPNFLLQLTQEVMYLYFAPDNLRF